MGYFGVGSFATKHANKRTNEFFFGRFQHILQWIFSYSHPIDWYTVPHTATHSATHSASHTATHAATHWPIQYILLWILSYSHPIDFSMLRIDYFATALALSQQRWLFRNDRRPRTSQHILWAKSQQILLRSILLLLRLLLNKHFKIKKKKSILTWKNPLDNVLESLLKSQKK